MQPVWGCIASHYRNSRRNDVRKVDISVLLFDHSYFSPPCAGGAERLVVDAAVALQRCGHTVDIYTSHHDPSHCFQETRDGTLNVIVYGDFLPTHILGKGAIVCATLRNLYAASRMVWSWGDASSSNAPSSSPSFSSSSAGSGAVHRRVTDGKYDLVFVDQISNALPILQLANTKVCRAYCKLSTLSRVYVQNIHPLLCSL